MPNSSSHARRRRAQRSVPEDHIDLALDWGQPIRQGEGRVAYHLGHREASEAAYAGIYVPERAVGLAVVVAADGTVVTVVRSPDRHRLVTYGRSRRRAGGAR